MIIPIERLTENRLLSEYIRFNFPASRHSRVMRRPVFGLGLNDADYVTMPKIDGRLTRCPAYRSWHNMIRRTNDPKFHIMHPTYSGVRVCREWHSFMAFRYWWLENQADNWDLDKDLLSFGSKVYSPDTCMFVPRWVNGIVNDCSSRRGDWPIGVSWHQRDKVFQVHCKDPITGMVKAAGSFRCAESAHAAWRELKLECIENLKPPMDAIDKRIYGRVVAIIEASQ